tara:strand:- start:2687 stop:3151 length:465 start_codon:yes stop_codon:yes gene_type:complete
VNELATIVSIDDRFVWLKGEVNSSCGSCDAKKGCGQGLLDAFFNREPRLLPLPLSSVEAKASESTTGSMPKEGDKLLIEVSSKTFYFSLFAAYCCPLLGLLLGAVVVDALTISEPIVLLGSFAGLFAGMLLGRALDLMSRKSRSQVLVKKIIRE